ncbi:MAG: DICT sensory domain-containing protein [Solirubrobacteraceae bacterium]
MYRFPIIDGSNGELSTAQLAQRTGVAPATLRMWESRHGFPSPARLPGGHRRYGDRDVELVREVSRLRRQGLSMPAAIDRVISAVAPAPASVFAGLRRLRPEVQPVILSKRALLGLTHAVEDEYCARGAKGLLVGCFQRERFYRQSERRWRELARTAELAVALADFQALREPADAPAEVPIADEAPLAREWALVIDAPGAQACVTAWEQPSESELPDGRRRFEVLWSFEPTVVRSASGLAIELLARLAPATAGRVPEALARPLPAPAPELRFASALAHRVVGYLGATIDRGGS